MTTSSAPFAPWPYEPTTPMARPADPQPPPPSPLLVSAVQPSPPLGLPPTTAVPTSAPAVSSSIEDPRPKAANRGRTWLARILALAIIGISLYIDVEALFLIPVLFVLIVPFEKMFPRHRQRIRRPHVLTDIGYALAGAALNVVGLIVAVPVAIISLAWVPGLLISPLVSMIPQAIMPFVGVAIFDLAIYWTHRWYHEVPFLWRFHAIHHSTERLDWISGFRNHPLDGTLIAPAAVFLLAAGFTAEFTGVLVVVQIVLGLFLHANVRWRLRPLHKLVITPEFHHWHHANEPGAINSNYSVFLPAWDLIFGSYFMPDDRRPTRYGVSEHIPDGMVAQLRHPLRGLPGWRTLLVAGLRHPIRSTRLCWRLFRLHVLRPIRQIGLGRKRALA